jgi:hypothetical protein
MTIRKQNKKAIKLWEKIIYFFPVQLLFVHLKKNLGLLLYWIILFSIVTKAITLKYGVPYLFLYPEYLGGVNFTSHFLMGLLAGGFIMAFNLSSYVVNGFRFSFLATLNRPFIKYCQNNLIIPLTFSVVYIVGMIQFQSESEQVDALQIFMNILGYVTGNILFIAVTAIYFISTNKNVGDYVSNKNLIHKHVNPIKDLFSKRSKWEIHSTKSRKEWKVVSYISDKGKIVLARDSSHYKRETLEKVFSQNRINASVFQTLVILAVFILGLFHENDWLRIPAAGSILLLFTVFIMLTSAFYSWFKGWASVVIIILLIGINYMSTKMVFSYENQAYGIDYTTEPVVYTPESILEFQENRQNLYPDVQNGLAILKNWKEQTGQQKPIAVFLNVPGGGLRSALWTMESLNQANTVTQEQLWQNVILISGASGGMVGAAFLREFYYQNSYENANHSFAEAKEDISKDKLNPVAVSAVLNDLFFRFKHFERDGNRYLKDRAYAFELKLNEDTHGWLDRSLKDYYELEFNRKIPMILLSPTISNDGRKLLISPQPISYLCYNTDSNQMNENIEFNRVFEHQNPGNLSYLSALRMSATFPYVFPAANLPTTPTTQVLDAGIRDNFGMSNTMKYIYFFKDWLEANTEKVIIVQVRDQPKFKSDIKMNKPSLFQEISQPFGMFYSTVLDVQDYQMDDLVQTSKSWYGGEIEVVDLVLNRSKANPISLSWHLTTREKQRIEQALLTEENQRVFKQLEREFTTD